MSEANVRNYVPIGHENGPRRGLRGPFPLVALSQFWSNKRWPEGQSDTYVTGGNDSMSSPVRQRRRITHGLRVEVVEYYERGMSSRRVAATFGLGRTTVLEILKSAGVTVRPQGRKY
jgi:hypothetical protein